MTEHTPGRWIVTREKNPEGELTSYRNVQTADKAGIALVYSRASEDAAEANARLIAAAPELLAAAKALLHVIAYEKVTAAESEQLHLAIAKAEVAS